MNYLEKILGIGENMNPAFRPIDCSEIIRGPAGLWGTREVCRRICSMATGGQIPQPSITKKVEKFVTIMNCL
jgi:hypothetical protein